MTQIPPQPSGASSSDVAAAISNAATPATGLAGGLTPVGMDWGVIVSIQAFTVTITLAGSPTSIAGVAYMANYTPTVSDTVIVWHVGSDLVVAGGLTGSTSSPIPVGAMLPFPQAFTNPAWLLCNGASYSTVTYPALYAFLGVSTVPDMRGVTPMGAGVNGVVLGTLDTVGQQPAHAHTGAAHTHTGAAHVHGSGGPHSHSHGHAYTNPASAGSNSVTGGTVAALVENAATTGVDATATDPGNTASTTPGASGSTTPGAGGSTGSGTANLPPQLGVDYFIRAR